jgi:hypothetical protein
MAYLFSTMFITCLFVTSSPLLANSSAWQYKAELTSFNHSESLPVMSLIEDTWEGPYQSGDMAMTSSKLTFQASNNRWQVGLSSRMDYLADYSPSTALLIYQDKNKISVVTNTFYPVNLKVNHLSAYGIYLGHKFTLSGIYFLLRTHLYNSVDLTHGEIDGYGNINPKWEITGELSVDYSYSQDLLFDRPEEDNNGYGYSFDLEMAGQLTDALNYQLQLFDILNQFYWDEKTYTVAEIIYTPDKAFNEPIMRGFEGYRDVQQKMPMQTAFNLNYHHDNSDIFLELSQYNHVWYYDVGWASFNKLLNAYLGFKMGLTTSSLGVFAKTKYLDVGIAIDNSNFNKANFINFNFALKL